MAVHRSCNLLKPDQSNLPRVAVLIDAENLSHNYSADILAKVDLIYGRSSEIRVYGSKSACKGWMKKLHPRCAKRKSPPETGKKKNRTDIMLIMDAMRMQHRDGFTHFWIASSDADFVLLAHGIRKDKGKATILAEKKAKKSLKGSGNDFVLLQPVATSAGKSARPKAA